MRVLTVNDKLITKSSLSEASLGKTLSMENSLAAYKIENLIECDESSKTTTDEDSFLHHKNSDAFGLTAPRATPELSVVTEQYNSINSLTIDQVCMF